MKIEKQVKEKTETATKVEQETSLAKTQSRKLSVETERQQIRAEKKFKKMEEKVKQSCSYCKLVQKQVIKKETEIT